MREAEFDAIVREFRSRYGPLIDAEQAAEVAHREVQTIYDWSSRGLLDGIKLNRKGVLLLSLEGFQRFLFDGDNN
jgi:hypothetical protein